ncbi:MAG: transfer agent orfg15, like protein [Tardiphaga sp.]|uniref:baseplate multidomain protein megatron n=1 Tax=Tardiphaga sp. TaxID=1926292 RepID=UPI0026303659|nr:glycoside hydrolase/phage tail family protein [Tardiphaga sp.]MDB5502158.1 transfer agent orfg15, like protein [Tardiphaga sp.]
MAALVLSAAGGAIGGVFGPIGAIAGRLAGAVVGNMLDQALFGPGAQTATGPRLADLDVMASTEGAPIPRVYGRARLGGQVIWATDLEEVATDDTTTPASDGGKGFGGGAAATATTTTTYTYFANFAVGLCEGAIGRVARVWADGKPLDLDGVNMRVYRGTEVQLPDGLIVAKQGAGNAPAYRGLAYVVFERLPLANFGNRIPQLSFEIIRPVGLLEQMVRAVTLIPGSTEFGYEPSATVQLLGPGQSAPENRHLASARSDVVAALDDLQGVCPNLQRVALVVAWFGSDLRAGHCLVRPGIDNAAKSTSPFTWSVDGVDRAHAYVVSQVDGFPAFGGTPSDDSVAHLIGELKARGLKVTFYPFVMMDVPAGNGLPDPWSGAGSQPPYPWRGRITCDPAPGRPGSPQGTATAATQVNDFFTGGVWNYRRMVLHYAQLCASAGGVEAFLIGSELKALTRVRSGAGVYPAVSALVSLAAEVKAIVGGALVTYGADWTEYGADVVDPAASEVRFPLDPLWASPAIGAVGIDYYAPLADWRDEAGHLDSEIAATTYDRAYLRDNVAAGEAYDWYYPNDVARDEQDRVEISDGLGKPWTFRVKDLWNWWSNPHHERVGGVEAGAPTAWTPHAKPIWLTEVGCPAVDKGANQPSVFPDPKSSENFIPYFSSGERDDLMQRRYCEAILSAFDPTFGATDADNPVSPVYGGRMVDASAIHLWTWDARPYPVFPAAQDIWSDGANWHTGHWLTGRLGGAPIDALVAKLLDDTGVGGVGASGLRDSCDGYVVDRPMAPRAMIEPLAMAYAFDATAADGTLRFIQRGGAPVVEIFEDELVATDDGALARLTRAQETELPAEVGLGFSDALVDYRRSAVTSRKLVGGARRMLHTDLAVITNDAAATRRAEIWLQDLWASRERVEFSLGISALRLAPGDVVALTLNARRRLFEIDGFVDTQARQVSARSIDPEVFAVPLAAPRMRRPAMPPSLGPVQAVALNLPVIDASKPDVLTRLAVFANPWPGSVVIWKSADGASFQVAAVAAAPSVVGETLDPLPAGPQARWDRGNACRVRLYGGALTALSDARVLGGGNAAAVQNAEGAWEILQFAQAELVDGNTYRLSRLLRGQLGSEPAMAALLPPGAPFVLLDRTLVPIARGVDALDRAMALRIVANGRAHDDPSAVALTVTTDATALKPLAPVQVRATRQADGIHITWIRRSRIDGDGWAVEVPLSEASEAYRLEIISGAAVIRTMSCATSQSLYAIADEIADFGAPQASLRVRVAQLSASVGAGFATDFTLVV